MEDKLKELVFTALGEASMCWNPQPSKQVFDDTKAVKIGEDLTNKILKLVEENK